MQENLNLNRNKLIELSKMLKTLKNMHRIIGHDKMAQKLKQRREMLEFLLNGTDVNIDKYIDELVKKITRIKQQNHIVFDDELSKIKEVCQNCKRHFPDCDCGEYKYKKIR